MALSFKPVASVTFRDNVPRQSNEAYDTSQAIYELRYQIVINAMLSIARNIANISTNAALS
ncbi:hypothetical protein [Corynebacterium ammoniagenes]|nr:hypothetical protein [Corynebacterium ammoniagenes]APT83180.1 hypothetical protein CAMM_09740 [Corynebacterium ammoniagenes DSM 20306]AQS74208.1 hypothetical protein CA40472_10065 [Corynebacterium ammoniagenes]EFG81588.1 hypothetical protein HMPREF0281_01370 [Corynebacterium ammoniagenes DSM 20306]NMF33011.1 hypothetical protein [Corynebacterium ammoniagenes]